MQAPFLSQSELTGRWWLVTRYSEDAKGNRVASTKHDLTEAVNWIRADTLREFADEIQHEAAEFPPGSDLTGTIISRAREKASRLHPQPNEREDAP